MPNTGYQYFTVKYDSSGGQKWVKLYTYCNSQGCDNFGDKVFVDKLGNIYVSGRSLNNQTGHIGFGTIKYTNLGDSIWVSRYDRVINISPSFKSMNLDRFGNFYITACAVDTSCVSWSYVTLKYDSSGNLGWETCYSVNPTSGAGSEAIVVDSLGNVYVTGGAGVAIAFSNQVDMCTIKYSQPLYGIKRISDKVPQRFILFQNYPNPFNPKTKIKFDVPSNVKRQTSDVWIIIYDILGREVQIIVNEPLKPGSYVVEWDGSNYSSGVYFCSLLYDGGVITKKLVLLK